MVDAQAETKLCSNCDKQIEASKFRMHEIQCARLNYKCKVCGQVVAKSDKEEHEAEAHIMEKCQYCGFEALKQSFGEHEARCEMRPKPCEYCNEMLKFERFQ